MAEPTNPQIAEMEAERLAWIERARALEADAVSEFESYIFESPTVSAFADDLTRLANSMVKGGPHEHYRAQAAMILGVIEQTRQRVVQQREARKRGGG